VISVVIPTLGRQDLLERYLPSVHASLAGSGERWETIVVDDGARGVGVLPTAARLVALDQGRGYGPAVNAGAQAASGEWLLVLNDDVSLESTTVRRLREAFPAQGVFACVPQILSSLARSGDESGKRAAVRAGLLEIEEAAAGQDGPTLFPVGCCFLCRREVFLGLGGYDDAFAPFLWEDVDLGYRAWRRGLATRRVPDARCHHEGSATIGVRAMAERERLWHRNWALFHLRNLNEPRLRAAALGAWTAYALFDERSTVHDGLREALALFERVGPRPDDGLSDQEILARVAGQ
jgi:GT2 family glycosyltransferase